ncbi:MAG: hypothetical protein JSR80_06695 [Verrucomicrobia bacterium]|nr:hypothetical protein [Verrucomicrobiota bacterium]
MKKLCLACFFFITLAANRDACPIPPQAVFDEPLGLIAGCVDAVTGAYVGSTAEVTVNCHEPITLYRQLITCADGAAGEGVKDNPNWENAGSTSFWQLGKEYLDFHSERHRKKTRFRIIGESGEITDYVVFSGSDRVFHSGGGCFFLRINPDQFISNTSHGEIGGRTHPRNNVLRYGGPSPEHAHYGPDAFTLTKGDGEVRIYTHGSKAWCRYRKWRKEENREPKQESFLLREVIRPNGNRIFYSYDHHDSLVEIRSANRDDSQTFGWIRVGAGQTSLGWGYFITTSDGQSVEMGTCTVTDPRDFKKCKTLLRSIAHTDGIVEDFGYSGGKNRLELDAHIMQKRSLLKIEYSPSSVKRIVKYQKYYIDHGEIAFGLRSVGRISALLGENGAFETLYSITPYFLSVRFDGETVDSGEVWGQVSVSTAEGAGLTYRVDDGRIWEVSDSRREITQRCLKSATDKGNLASHSIKASSGPLFHEEFSYDLYQFPNIKS